MWFSSLEKYANFRNMSDEHKLAFLPVVLKDAASDWFDMLPDETRSSWEQLRTKFKERFQDSDVMRWQKASKLWGRDQGQHESVDAYATALQKIAKSAGVHDDMLRYAIMRGLRKELRAHVIQSGVTTLSGLIDAARIAEIAAGDGSTSTTPDGPLLGQLLDEMSASRRAAEQNAAEIQRLTARLASTTVSTVDRPPPVSRSSSPRRVTFSGDNVDARRHTPPPPTQFYAGRATYQSGRDQRPRQRGPPPGPLRSRSPRPSMQDNRSSTPVHITCGNCGGLHQPGNRYCRAYGVACFNCQGMNHLARMCRRGRRPSQRGYQNI